MQTQKINHKHPFKTAGFTLIEMLVVVAIMATLAAMIAPNLIKKAEESKVTAAKADIQQIASALDIYKLDNFSYPSSDQGLEALISKPSGSPEPKNWRSPYLKKTPVDPWGNEYYYAYPGENGEFDVYSLGADGQPGGEDTGADIGSWQ